MKVAKSDRLQHNSEHHQSHLTLLFGIYPLPAMHSLLVTSDVLNIQLLTVYQGVNNTYFIKIDFLLYKINSHQNLLK